jgi:folate-binding protein YgfZ
MNASDAFPLPPAVSGACVLPEWGLIRAVGPDAGTFLQGQLSNDVLSQSVGEARWAGYCSAKGRLLASFLVLRRGPEEWWLLCSADLLAQTLKRLRMYVLRAKCVLDEPGLALHGGCGLDGLPAVAALAPMGAVAEGEAHWVRLADVAGQPRWLRAGPAGSAPPGADLDLAHWQWLEVRSGVARVVAATVEAFVPQMVNLELVGGVNFKKGCYPGQEVVARSQYRGTLKRRTQLWRSPVALQPGQEVFHSGDPSQPAGAVVLAAPAAGAWEALVETRLEALQGGTLHLGAADGPALQPGRLPYEVPFEAT